jgi:uncharacterized protein
MWFQAKQVKFEYENHSLVPKEDPDFKVYQNFLEEFGDDGNKMVVGFQSEEVFNLQVFTALNHVCNEVKKINGVYEVLSVTNLSKLTKNDSLGRFELIPFFDSVPQSQEALDSLKIEILKHKFYADRLYVKEKHVYLIVLSLNKEVLYTENRVELMQQIKDNFEAFSDSTGIKIHYSGMPFIRNDFSLLVKDELIKFTIIAACVTALFLLLFFQSLTNIVIPLLIVGLSVIWSVGIIHIFDFKITLLTGLIPPLMVVIGIPNCIYLINKYHIEFKKHGNKIKSLTRVIARVGPANMLTNITTSIGFGVFYFTKTTVLVQFGVIAFFSILSIFLLTILFIPVIYSYLPSPRKWQLKHLDNRFTLGFINKIHSVVFQKRRRIYFFAFVMIIISSFGFLKLKPLVFMVDDLPEDAPLYSDLQFFQKNFSGVMPLEIIIDTEEVDGLKDTRTLQKIYTLQKRLAEYPEFSKPLSIVEVLSYANQTWNNNQEKYYLLPNKTQLANISTYMPASSNIDGERTVLNSMVDKDFRKARISIQMADIGSIRMEELNEELNEMLVDIFPKDTYKTKITGQSYIFLKGNSYLVKSLFQSVLIAFIMIAIIMGALFTSIKMIVVSMIPNAVPLILTAGIMGHFDVPLKPSTILIFSIAFGIAVDDTIHFLTKFRQELIRTGKPIKHVLSLTLNETGTSLLYTSVVLFFGFIMFGFSDFESTVALGLLTSISLLFALFSNLYILPALILSYEKRLNPKVELKEALIELPDDTDEDETNQTNS